MPESPLRTLIGRFRRQNSQSGQNMEMKQRTDCRSIWWFLPPLIFVCAASLRGGAPEEDEMLIRVVIVFGSAVMLPFCVWIAVASSCRRNGFLFYPAVVFLSLLELWPLALLFSWAAGALFAAMLVMNVILHGRLWIILHSVFLWLYGALLIAVLWFSQAFDVAFGAPKNPWLEPLTGFIVFALIAVIFVRLGVQNMIDRRRKTAPERGEDHHH